MTQTEKMTFLQHLEELRYRIIRSLAAILLGAIVCWFFREEILAFLLAPLYDAWRNVDGFPEPKPLNFSSMLEPFIAYLKISAIGGLFVSAPVVLYQLWKFIAPGLYKKERKMALPFVLVSSLLFVGGSMMAYSIVFPIGFHFFLEFASAREMVDVETEVTIAENPGTPKIPIAGHDSPIDVARSAADLADQADRERDGGPESDAGLESSPIPIATTTTEQKPSWFKGLLSSIISPPCGNLSGLEGKSPGQVQLTFRWNKTQCGELPSMEKFKRSGELLPISWNEDPSPPAGFAVFKGTDNQVPHGPHTYSLRVPKSSKVKQLVPVLMVKDYLSLAVRLLLAFGIVFELPILIAFLSLAGIVNYRQLIRFTRWFLVISLVAGALLTPPDIFTQMFLAVPLLLLYAISIVFAYLFGPKVDD